MIKYLSLSDVCTSITDCPHESPKWRKKSGEIILRNFNLADGQIDLSDIYFVDEKTYSKRTKRAIPEEGDIVFSREAPIGNCAIIPPNFKCCLGQRLVLLKVNRSICSPEYLLTVMMSDFVKQQIEQVSKRGSIVSNFNISELKKLKIPILKNQDSIAKFSTLLSTKISTNNHIISELESLTKTIYDYWFMQFDFPDENGKPYRSSGGKMVWNDELKREIPEGWDAVKFGVIADFVKGKIPSFELSDEKDEINSTPYVTIDVANDAKPMYCNPEKLISLNGETIMVMDGAASGDVYIGNYGILGSTFSKISSNRKDISDALIYMLLNSHNVVYKKANTGSTVPHANTNFIKQMTIAIPKDCSNISEQFKKLFKIIENCRKENETLASLRDFLLPMLMNGQTVIND